MNLNKCCRCGCFYSSEGNVCPNCQPKDFNEIAKLSRNLKKGEYEATATISAYDTTTEELLGISAAKMVIAVEN